ncbi:GAF domain-containing protein [Sphingomonas lacusdianchii]|uniref:GAF domain-containing protein n=1 Tax=Sphingomonas lacusdianchii TaxID=2917992 RepID=UPI001F566B26|nr:GAF domain-containing protein [Sphingomonas sp. JXJ CY 53]
MFKTLLRERRRTGAVRDLDILRTPAEPAFDRLVDAAATAFDAPIALLSLIHGQQQWFKATHGLTIDCIDREDGFCGFALDSDEVLESCAPMDDPRFANLPVVTSDPHIRYYIGAALRRLNGVDVGALCVLDIAARPPASPDQKAYLAGLARQASVALETRLDSLGEGAAA